MLLSETLRSQRPRKVYNTKRRREEAAAGSASISQDSPFPVDDTPRVAENLKENAAEKEEVKRAAAAIPEIFTPEQVVWCFDAYVAILSFVYSLVLKVDYKAIQNELEFTPEQKEQMAKPLARICSKYAPSEWAGMTAEIQLVILLGVWTVASFQRVRNVQKLLAEKQKDAERTRPVQPIRREPVADIHVPA